MKTICTVKDVLLSGELLQGDVFKDVGQIHSMSENGNIIELTEYIFPYVIVLSQACDVFSASELISTKSGKATKYMPSILVAPIYDYEVFKSGAHISEIITDISINIQQDCLCNSKVREVVASDDHYRFHNFSVDKPYDSYFPDSIIDFKHYFTVSPEYLLDNRKNRIFSVAELYSEQITLKFSAYLSRVAFPIK